MTSRKNGKDTATGRFQHGNPGRPQGARHKVTRAIEALLEGEHEALTRKAIEKALEGDMVALRLCLDRIAPVRKGAPVTMTLPPVKSAQEAVSASQALLAAVSSGEINPEEGASVMGLLVGHKAILEAGDLEQRIAALESKAK